METLEFRDGPRAVPSHVAYLMAGLDTLRYTYEQALAIANAKVLTDYLGKVQVGVLRDHFKEHPNS